MADKNWDLAVQLRGRSFMRNLETFRMLSKHLPKNLEESNGRNLAVINVGAPCCGVNAAGEFLTARNKGSFKNHVDIILLFFDHPPTLVDIFYVLNVDKNGKF